MQTVPSGGQVFSVTQEHEVVNREAETIQTEFCFAFQLADSFLLQQIYWERPDLAAADSYWKDCFSFCGKL